MKLYRKKYKLIETYGVFFVDFIAIAASYFLAHKLRLMIPFGAEIENDKEWFPIYALCILGCVLYNLSTGRYEGFFRRGYLIEFGEVIKYNVVQFAFLSASVYIFRLEDNFSRILLAYYLICYTILGYLLRVLFKKYIIKFYKKGKGSEKVFIITDREHFESVWGNIRNDKGWSYEIIGLSLIDCEQKSQVEQIISSSSLKKEEIPQFITGIENLIENVRQMPIDIVFFYCKCEDSTLERWIQAFVLMGVQCYYCVQSLDFHMSCNGAGEFANLPVIYFNSLEQDWRIAFIKRSTDIIGSIIGLIFTVFVLLFVGPIIKIEDPKGPIFFSQIRIGKNGRRFRMYKFRSMYADAENMKKDLLEKNEVTGPMFKIENDPRITKVGRFLRRTSMDELPQFWNILKGDMSLVGTRPPTVEEFEQYNDYYRRRMSITPGLTGLWQVSGRSDIKDFNEVVKLDLQYIDNWSIGQDIKILLQTFGVVIKGTGSK